MPPSKLARCILGHWSDVTPVVQLALDASGAAAAYRRKSVLLTLDVGNTNVTAGVFDGDELKATWRTATDRSRTTDEYGLALSQLLPLKGVPANSVTDVCLCSVVPPLTSSFVELCKQYFDADPLTVDAGVKTGVRVLYDSPRDVGPDRIADAVAALHLYGGPAIVVDFGTATVFDAVSAKGEYLGGDRTGHRTGDRRFVCQHFTPEKSPAVSSQLRDWEEHGPLPAVRHCARLHRSGHRNGEAIPS